MMLLITNKNHKITTRFYVKSIDKFMYSTGATMTNKNDSIMFRGIDRISDNISSFMPIGQRKRFDLIHRLAKRLHSVLFYQEHLIRNSTQKIDGPEGTKQKVLKNLK